MWSEAHSIRRNDLQPGADVGSVSLDKMKAAQVTGESSTFSFQNPVRLHRRPPRRAPQRRGAGVGQQHTSSCSHRASMQVKIASREANSSSELTFSTSAVNPTMSANMTVGLKPFFGRWRQPKSKAKFGITRALLKIPAPVVKKAGVHKKVTKL